MFFYFLLKWISLLGVGRWWVPDATTPRQQRRRKKHEITYIYWTYTVDTYVEFGRGRWGRSSKERDHLVRAESGGFGS